MIFTSSYEGFYAVRAFDGQADSKKPYVPYESDLLKTRLTS